MPEIYVHAVKGARSTRSARVKDITDAVVKNFCVPPKP